MVIVSTGCTYSLQILGQFKVELEEENADLSAKLKKLLDQVCPGLMTALGLRVDYMLLITL